MNLRSAIEGLIEAWNANDALRASAFFAPDAVYREAGRTGIAGRDAIGAHFARFFREGPPWRFHVDTIVVEGERGAVAYRFELKRADGSWIAREGCALVASENGAISQWREYQE